jgi:hypothetical protein
VWVCVSFYVWVFEWACVFVCVCVCVVIRLGERVCVMWLFACVCVLCVWNCVWCVCEFAFVCVGVGYCVCVWGVRLGSVNGVFIFSAQTGKRLFVLVRNFAQFCRKSCLRQISELNTNPTLNLILPATNRPAVVTMAFFRPTTRYRTAATQTRFTLRYRGVEMWFCDPIGWQQLFVWEGRNGG